MIRLLILTDTNIDASYGGAERHLRNLVEHIDYERFHVDVLQLSRRVWEPRSRVAGANVAHLATGRLLSRHGLGCMWQILQRMRAGRYHCVLSVFESSDVLAALLAPLAGIGVRISSRRDTGFRYSWRIHLMYRLLNHRFHYIIAPSAAVRETLVAQGVNAKRLLIIPNGVDTARFECGDPRSLRRELGLGEDALVLGMVASLKPVKDHVTALQALALLHRQGWPAHLVLAGHGPLQAELQAQAQTTGLGDYVHFLGVRDNVSSILAGVDVFLLTSLTEGLSNALLEAMAAGLPAVATRVGGNPEVVVDGETGYLVEPQQPQALCQSIARLAGDAALRRRLGQAGRARVLEHFSLNAMVQRYEDIICQALQERRRLEERSLRWTT
ncbi:MAG TPA: glycosyltransferase [Candidatus Competibacteraceae bacterium]|nr:glycosyltransferase [Candidatus Competibacteraceae bacterium]